LDLPCKGEEVKGGWRKSHSEEFHNYALPNIIRIIESRRIRWTGNVARMREFRNVSIILVGKSEGKISFGRCRCRWDDNIKFHLKKIGWEDVDWVHLAADSDRWRVLVITVMNCRVPQKTENFLIS
jgi:hypothetical protein